MEIVHRFSESFGVTKVTRFERIAPNTSQFVASIHNLDQATVDALLDAAVLSSLGATTAALTIDGRIFDNLDPEFSIDGLTGPVMPPAHTLATDVPEPSTHLLLAVGMASLVLVAARRRRQATSQTR